MSGGTVALTLGLLMSPLGSWLNLFTFGGIWLETFWDMKSDTSAQRKCPTFSAFDNVAMTM